MKPIKKLLSLLAVCMAVLVAPAAADDIAFSFVVPRISFPPEISNVSSTAAITGLASFTVTADIVGHEQKKAFCDVIPESECAASDWYLAPDPDISPNPPAIQTARVYYYYNDDVSSPSSVSMIYDSNYAKYRAAIPLAGTGAGDTITYYIVAVDSFGNVASQAPDKTQRPCPSSSSWDDSLATPAAGSCSHATSYEQCGEIISGQPAPCAEDEYTLADKQDDVCGEPDGGGHQNLISGPNADRMDILGMSAGADSTYICVKLGLQGQPVGIDGPMPIDSYIIFFYNPDIPDLNPGDTHIENAYVITYAPEAMGSDPTLVKVLWSGDCVTDPDTTNPLDCKLISAVGANENLKIEYNTVAVRFMTKKSGTGNPYNISYNLIGGSSSLSILQAVTGEINLSGGTAYWESDASPAFAFYHTNKTVTVETEGPIIPLADIHAKCGSSSTGVCPKGDVQPDKNVCHFTINVTGDTSFVDELRIYRNTVNNALTATRIGSIPDIGAISSYQFDDTHTVLDGTKTYYYVTGYNSSTGWETEISQASKTSCTIEDWVAPSAPEITAAATPPGNTGKCEIHWTVDEDPTLSNFYLSRDGAPINFSNPLSAGAGVTEYSYPDPQSLVNGQAYNYTVTAFDLGDNTAESLSVTCTPEDLDAPSQIATAIATNISGSLGVDMAWSASTENDLAGYNVYYCPQANPLVDCRAADEFARMNSSLITDAHFSIDSTQAPDIITGEGDYCFYVEACDDCAAQGTCPGNGGSPNCSGFPAGGADSSLYVKCLNLTTESDNSPPTYPGGLTCTTPDQGNTNIVKWNKVCQDADGTPFEDCDNPTPREVVGYKVIHGSQGAVPHIAVAQPSDIVGITSAGMYTEITHSNLNNQQQYCYNVFAMDSLANYSTDGPGGTKQEVCCTPQDTLAPDKPGMQDIPHTASSCHPAWHAVQDKDSLTYNLYRCNGGSIECNSGDDFSAVATGITAGGDMLSLFDDDVNPDSLYTYCATAVDPSGNDSAVFESGDSANCGVCTPGNRANPPSEAGAATIVPGSGAKLYWTNSVDHDASGGYNVYRCNSPDCGFPVGPVQTCVAGNRTQLNPLMLDHEPCGDWYYGVTYMKNCLDPSTESLLPGVSTAISDDALSIQSPYPACETRCIIVSSCKDYDAADRCVPVTITDTGRTGADGKYLVNGKSGLSVFLADYSDDPVADAFTITDSGGNFKLVINNFTAGLNTSSTYSLILKVPAAQKSGMACSPGFSGDDCYIILSKDVKIEEDAEVKVSGLSLGGGGRAEIGNADCSDSVDVGDLLLFKAAFGSSKGGADYKTYADFDGNGTIDVEDFLILKKNFGKVLDAAPAPVPGLCKE